MMYLALRKTPADSATWYERLFASLTKLRLCSSYSHGGVVINNKMYHSTTRRGLHCSDFTPEKWDLFPITGDADETLSLFHSLEGSKYNWLGVFNFLLPIFPSHPKRFYCFEWCAKVLNITSRGLMTPELLLTHAKRPCTNPSQ